MEILTAPDRRRQRVAAVGMYDGVHLGHRFLIDRVKEKAADMGITPAVVTFPTHPMAVVRPQDTPVLLTPVDLKEQLLARAGVEDCILLDFNESMRRHKAIDFLKLLAKKYNVKVLVIGYDNRLGSDRQAGRELCEKAGKEAGIEIVMAPEYTGPGAPVSSSIIRQYLVKGDVAKAAESLGRPYRLRGRVVDGDKVGRGMGYPTANIVPAEENLLVPMPGVYAVRVVTPDGEQHLGMVNIGYRPTMDMGDGRLTIEAHILDYSGYLYDEEINIDFIAYLRSERKFRSLETLKKQLIADEKKVRKLLK